MFVLSSKHGQGEIPWQLPNLGCLKLNDHNGYIWYHIRIRYMGFRAEGLGLRDTMMGIYGNEYRFPNIVT